jgi:hypothetical protein
LVTELKKAHEMKKVKALSFNLDEDEEEDEEEEKETKDEEENSRGKNNQSTSSKVWIKVNKKIIKKIKIVNDTGTY